MRRLLHTAALTAFVGLGALFGSADPAEARDRDNYWQGYWGWYDNDYRPYWYRHGRHYRGHDRDDDDRWNDRDDRWRDRDDDDDWRRNRGYRYRHWNYRPYRGNSVEVGPLRFYWR